MNTANSRKIFNYDNIHESKIVQKLSDTTEAYENSISACGCLFYKIVDNAVQLLLIKYTDPNFPRLDDLGGKVDIEDLSVFDAMVREVREESNNVIVVDHIKMLINDITKTYYNKKSKYYMWLVQVDDTFFPDTRIFGNSELHDNIERSIQWYNFNEVKDRLAFRLLNNQELIHYIVSLTE